MPNLSSGVMFGVNIVPNGVAIGRPPANSLPPRTVWQAIQSPARARYSPCFTSAALSAGVAAIAPPEWRLSPPDQRTAPAATAATTTAESANRDLRFILLSLLTPYCGSLPHLSGVFNEPAGAGTGLAGAVCVESHAATAVTSSSVRREAICCMQSGAMACRVPERQAPTCALM